MPEDAIDRGERRPFGFVLLIVLWLVYGLLPVLYLLEVPGIPAAGLVRAMDPQGDNPIANGILVTVALSTAIGLWRGWQGAYVVAMLLIGGSLAIEIWGYTQGTPAYAYTAVGVIITFYLNQASVRRRFFDTTGAGRTADDR